MAARHPRAEQLWHQLRCFQSSITSGYMRCQREFSVLVRAVRPHRLVTAHVEIPLGILSLVDSLRFHALLTLSAIFIESSSVPVCCIAPQNHEVFVSLCKQADDMFIFFPVTRLASKPLRRFFTVIGALLVAGFAAAPVLAETLRGQVVTVFDGDSFILLVGDAQIGIRMVEIDTPEVGQDWHDEAGRALRRKILRQAVAVDIVDRDRYGRLVGKVWLGERDINREMIVEGHAWAYRQYLRDESLLEDEAAAREATLGLWALADPLPPWRWRHQQRGGEEQKTAADCRIKGNISSSGKRIYHVPGQQYYEQTRISTGKGERWFCTEAAARKAGWRRSRV